MKKPILAALFVFCALVINAQNNEEWYRFQLTGFAGYGYNFGKPCLPLNILDYGPTAQSSTTYFGSKETGTLSYGTSFLSFPSFLRFGRFCIASGVGTMQLNNLVSADSVVTEWSSSVPTPTSLRTVAYDLQWNIQERFIQFPILLRAYLIRRGRFVTHADFGVSPSLLLSRSNNLYTTDTYKKTFFGTSFYTADLNVSYRIKSSNKYGFFITAGITSQMAVTETQKQRRPGMLGGLLALRFDAY